MINHLGAARSITGHLGQGKAAAEDEGLTIYVSDTFTDSDTTSLDAHTPDIDAEAGGWTEAFGSWEINGNRADTISGYLRMRATIDAGIADGQITLDVTWAESTMNASFYNNNGILLRYTDDDNYIAIGFYDGYFCINNRSGGADNEDDAVAFTPSLYSTYTIWVEANGTEITAKLDGSYEISTTTSNGQSSTVHGSIGFRNRCNFDNFLVQG